MRLKFISKTVHDAVFIMILVSLIAAAGRAQILNADRSAPGSDSAKSELHAFINLGLDINQEEERVLKFKTSSEILYQFQKNVLILLSQYDITSAENVKLINAGYSHLRFRINRDARIQPEAFAQYQWNGVRGMKSRLLAGANMRFQVKKDSLTSAYLAIGLMDERETWDYRSVPVEKVPLNAADRETDFVKLNSYVNLNRKLSPHVGAAFMVYLQARPNKNIVYPRISPLLNVNFRISRNLSMAMMFSGMYDRKPVVPIRKFFYDFSTAINVRF